MMTRGLRILLTLCCTQAALSQTRLGRSDAAGLFEGRCAGCHALEYEMRTPRLAGVFGRPVGTLPAFPYSKALRDSRIVWTATNLDRFLTDTDNFLPGNAMSIRVPEPDVRAAIIDYLRLRARPRRAQFLGRPPKRVRANIGHECSPGNTYSRGTRLCRSSERRESNTEKP